MNDIETLRHLLADAARAGEVVRIVYLGGSQPGAVREIVPLAVTQSDVLARDLAAGITKTFSLAKITRPDAMTIAVAYDPAQTVDTRSVRDALEGHSKNLEGLGWHVELSDVGISLHRFLKNGKPRKTGDVALWFEEFVIDAFDDFDGRDMQTVRRPSQRPYHVSSMRVATRSFTALSRALLVFLDEAKGLAPGRSPSTSV